MVTITIQEQGNRPQRMTFSGAQVDIGRADDNDVVLPARNISKHHARLLLRGADFVITDLGSTNGTVVNGRRISAPHVLQPNDVLSIGFFRLTLTWEATREESSASSSGPFPPPSGLVRSPETVPNRRRGEGSPTLDRLPALDAEGELVDSAIEGTSSDDFIAPSPRDEGSAAWPGLPELLERTGDLGLNVLLVVPVGIAAATVAAWSGHAVATQRDDAPGGRRGLHFVDSPEELRPLLLERAAGVGGGALVLPARSATQGMMRLLVLSTASLGQQVPLSPLHMSAMLDFVVHVGEDHDGDPVLREVCMLHASASDPSGLVDLSLIDAARLDSLPRSLRDVLRDLLRARSDTVPHPISATRP